MQTVSPKSAMVFAAGFGTRMRHLTSDKPKPLVNVLGRPMIDHSLNILSHANIETVVVNTHYFSDQLEKHLSSHDYVTTINEHPNILETGGGLKNALPIIGHDPLYTLNCDALWLGENPALELAKHWNPNEMDALLLVLRKSNTFAYTGTGDFFLDTENKLSRKGNAKHAPYVYSGIQIIKTNQLKDIDSDSFSIGVLWDQMIANRRLSGLIYNGDWVDVGTPEGIEIAENKVINV